jgi:hypothetical protein
MTHGQGLAFGVEIGCGIRVFLDVGVAGDAHQQAVQARRDLEAAARQVDGRLEQAGPGQAAVAFVGAGVEGDGTGNADGMAALDAYRMGQRRAVLGQEHVRQGAGGRGLAAVDDLELRALRVPGEEEAATADPGTLGLHQTQDQMGGDGRVGGAATLAQHAHAGLRGVRVGGIDHRGAGFPRRIVARRRRTPAGGQQDDDRGQDERAHDGLRDGERWALP